MTPRPVRITNTATRSREELVPLEPGRIALYTCGPTVHDFAHIGNFRTFTFYDTVRRSLARLGYRVHQVMNLTDVEDRIIRKASAAGVPIREFTARYVEAFHADRRSLRIADAEQYPLATDHVPEMIEIIAALERRGHTYRSEGSVYYRVASFPGYGRLSRIDFAGQLAGARVDADDDDKQEARDFALWKAAKPGEPSWDSPFGPGRPGWHIECSAMAMRYLGRTFDLHAGGVDLIFPHHENEIAQSEGATGETFARYWVHAEFLNIQGDKMSKRTGNFATLRDLLDAGIPARALRYAFLNCHYRKPMNYTGETVQQAEGALARLDNTLLRLDTEPHGGGSGAADGACDRAERALDEALADDFNTPEALAALHNLLTEVNTLLDRSELGPSDAGRVRSAIAAFDDALALLPEAAAEAPAELLELIRLREAARQRREWAEADRLRARATELGFVLEDVKTGGTRWKRL